MKRKVLLATFTLFLCISGIYAQPCPPYPAALGCGLADPDCQNGLDGYCNTLGVQTQQTEPLPGCGGTAVLNNDDWIAFYAGSETITVVITPSNCQGTGGTVGVQAGFYSDCDDDGGINGDGLASGPLTTQCACTTAPITLNYNQFVVGQTYYIVIDGCGGDICDYVINVTEGSTQSLPPEDPTGITGPTTICPGAIVEYFTDPIFGIPAWNWSIIGGQIVGNPAANPVSVQWNSSGSITVFGENDCYTTAPVTLNVTVETPPPGNDEGSYCQGASYIYPGNGNPYTAGSYTIDMPGQGANGCDSSLVLDVIEYPTPFTDLYKTICEGECVEVGGVPYCETGQWNVTLQTSFGCDSTVYLDLTVLDPVAFVLEPLAINCYFDQVVVDGTLSFGDSYEWSTFDGCIDGSTTSPIITACAPGNYCLTVTSMGLDEGLPVSCEEEFCIDVLDDTEGEEITTEETAVTCESSQDGTATANLVNGALDPNDFIFVWNSSPTQVAQTATGLSGGNYCVTVTSIANGCTTEQCVNIPSPEAIVIDIISEDIICNGEDSGSATASGNGGAGGLVYEWDSSPIQTGPTATGLAAGVYTVVATDLNGCTESEVVEIFEPAAMMSSTSFEDANCNGEGSGSASIDVSGGNGLLSYSWNTNPVQDSSTAINLTAGDYTVLVTDENGCTIEESFTIGEPSAIALTESTTLTSCNNTPDGSATVSASGGVGPYGYQWDANANNQTTATATDLTSGDYTVTVTDGNGCTSEITASVTSPNGMTVVPDFTNASCNGGDDGSATVPTSGGTSPYTYIWDDPNAQTTETAIGLTAGTYNVTVTDLNGCEEYETFIITEPDAVTMSSTTQDILCNQETNGSASLTPVGGTGGYTYLWDDPNGQTTATATGLAAGTYTVIVTDENDCTGTETVVIDEPALLSLSIDGEDALCNQVANGEATVSPSGGVSPYTYLWNDVAAQTDATAVDLLAGDYIVTVTDTNGCTEQINITIDEPPLLTLDTEGTDPDCNDSQNGTATVTPSGGTGPYTYLWDDTNAQTGATATGLDGGTVTVIVTDANGCTESQSVSLTAPQALSLTTSQSNILCFGGSTGDATVNVSGGTSPYTYVWDDAPVFQNTATAVNLAAGSYTVVVTDANDCTQSITVDLAEPAAALNATGTSTDALCGVDNGSIDLTPTGGTAPYTFNWNNGLYTVEDPQNLSPGTYTVVVTDVNGCTFTTSVEVSTPSGLGASVSITNVSCNGETNGQIDVAVVGGITPYDFDWDVDSNDGNEDFVDVGAGSYNLIITDNDGCTFTVNALVEEPDALDATATPSQASCGLSDGSISLVVSGGVGGYTFAWENDVTGDMYMDQSPNSLPQGDYTGVVTDANGCTITVTASVTVPNGPVVNLTAFDLSCFENSSGSIEVDVVGGDAPYTYEWLNDPTYNGQDDLTDIVAGTWEVLVTDDNNCSTTASVEVMQPDLLEVSASMTPVSCFGDSDGTLSALATGGTGMVSYSWDVPGGDPNTAPAGVYTVTATDANGCTAVNTVEVTEPSALQASASAVDVDCNGSSTGALLSQVGGGTAPYTYTWSGGIANPTDPNPTGVPANSYTVIVTDANGCTTLAQTDVNEPAALTASTESFESSCGEPNGSIDLTVNGGANPYTYQWDDGNGQTIEDPINLLPGTYTVIITDANGCTLDYSETVTTPSALGISGTGEDVSCYGGSDGSAAITVIGGTPPFTYQWNDPNNQTIEDAENLPEGTWEVIVTDGSGCTIAQSIVIEEPPIFEAFNQVATGVSCNGGGDGSIILDVTGGTAPYSFQWDNTPQAVQNPVNLSAGTYAVTVTDAQGCTATETVEITQPQAILLSTTPQAAACNGNSDGSIDLTVQGGVSPYTYSWNNGQYTEEDPAGILAGQYTVIVTDANDCTQTTTVTVDEPAALQIVIDNVSNYGGFNVTCWNAEDGTAEAIASGGTAPYSYAWSNGAGTAVLEDLGPGIYDVIVTDGEGCTNDAQVELTAPQAITGVVAAVDVDCYGESDGQVIVSSVSGGAPPYMYSIGNAFSSVNQFTNLPAGEYEVTVEDVNGCQWSPAQAVTISEPEEFIVTIEAGNSTDDVVIDMGDSIQLFPMLSPGGTIVDTFVWKERELQDYNPWVQPWETQSYSIVVTNENGCRTEDMILVRVNKDRLVYIPNTFSPNNDGFNDLFRIHTGRGVEKVENFKIFSRWGELVYELPVAELNNALQGWDGTLKGEALNPGVFVYVAEVTFIDGRVEIYKGDVTLTK